MVISLCTHGMSVRDIVHHLEQVYVLELQLACFLPQISELFLLGGRELRPTVIVGVGLAHPVTEAGLADAEILGELCDRFIALACELDGPLAKLDRMWCWHGHALPC
jgi:hypothetical protein